MSIELQGYNVSFDRLKIEKEYKHPIFYDKFPIKANNSTMIHVSEPKIPFRFPDYGCLWNGKKENQFFNANPFKNLKDIEKYYLPPNSVNNMIKPPMFTGSTKIFLNNNIESIHEQWQLFSHNTGLKKTKEVVEKFGVSSGTTDQKEIEALPEMMPTAGSIGSASGFGTPEGSPRGSISNVGSVRAEAQPRRELTEEEARTARYFEALRGTPRVEATEQLKPEESQEYKELVPAYMDRLIKDENIEGGETPPPYTETNPFPYMAKIPDTEIEAIQLRISKIVVLSKEDQVRALKDLEAQVYNMDNGEQIKNIINHYVKRYNEDYNNKTDDEISKEYKKFTDYSSFRMKAIVKALKSLKQSSQTGEAIELDRKNLTNEAINIVMDLSLLKARLSKIELSAEESKIYTNLFQNPQYKAKAHKLHSLSLMDAHEFKIMANKLATNNVNMFLEKDKITFKNKTTGAKVVHQQVFDILKA